MNESVEKSTNWKLDDLLRSDLLPHLVGLIRAFPGFQPLFPQILKVRVVIDANIVQSELRWRLKTRRKVNARSALEEVLTCGVLIAFAPHYLEEEILEHAPCLAVATKRNVEDVLEEWKDFRRHISFYTAQERAKIDVSRTDPDDTAYIDTVEEIGARAIYTRDRDFLRTTVPVILVTVEDALQGALQQYARASTVSIGVAVGSSVSMMVGLEALTTLAQLLRKLAQAAKRLPPAMQLLILGTVTAAVAHPKSRAKLAHLWQSLNRTLKPSIWEAIVEGMHQFLDAVATAENGYRVVQEMLPPCKRRPLMVHVRGVCLTAHRPLSLDELVAAAIANGYVPRSSRPHAYLRRRLRGDSRFRETDDGWIVGEEQATSASHGGKILPTL